MSWKVMEFERAFFRPGKVMVLGKMAEVMEKSWNFIFWSKYFMLFEKWKHFPCHTAKICPRKAGFSAAFSHRGLKLVMEKSLNFIAQFLCDLYLLKVVFNCIFRCRDTLINLLWYLSCMQLCCTWVHKVSNQHKIWILFDGTKVAKPENIINSLL